MFSSYALLMISATSSCVNGTGEVALPNSRTRFLRLLYDAVRDDGEDLLLREAV
jgi:hypothetical protein